MGWLLIAFIVCMVIFLNIYSRQPEPAASQNYDRIASDEMMQTEQFQTLAKLVQESMTQEVLSSARYHRDPYFLLNRSSIWVYPGQDEDDLGLSSICGVSLESLGYKPIKNYEQIRILLYSIGRLDGFIYCYEPEHYVAYQHARMPQISVYPDEHYWKEIHHKEVIRLEDEKNAGLKDFF